MSKIICTFLVLLGVVLLILGLNAGDALSSNITDFFTRSPTSRSMWMLMGGAASTALGLAGCLRSRKTL